jgi:hypothetical protein
MIPVHLQRVRGLDFCMDDEDQDERSALIAG